MLLHLFGLCLCSTVYYVDFFTATVVFYAI